MDNHILLAKRYNDILLLLELGIKKDQVKIDIEKAAPIVAGYLGLEEKSVKLEFSNQYGYTYRITQKEEKQVRKKMKEMIEIDTKTSGVRFRDRKLDKLNRDYQNLSLEFEQQQKVVFEEICNVTCGYAQFFSSMGHLISNIDCLVGFSVRRLKLFRSTNVFIVCLSYLRNFSPTFLGGCCCCSRALFETNFRGPRKSLFINKVGKC